MSTSKNFIKKGPKVNKGLSQILSRTFAAFVTDDDLICQPIRGDVFGVSCRDVADAIISAASCIPARSDDGGKKVVGGNYSTARIIDELHLTNSPFIGEFFPVRGAQRSDLQMIDPILTTRQLIFSLATITTIVNRTIILGPKMVAETTTSAVSV